MRWKNNFVFFCFVFCCSVAMAQMPAIKNERKDTTTVNNLLQASKDVFSSDPAKAIAYSMQAKALSEKLDFKKGIATALKNIGIAHYYQGNNLEALSFYQQSLNVFKTLNDENGVSNIQSN
ncbi:MAG TPA: tetratricopeptide repeat protein, partial [Niastella sp.]|nr:tetratricopeptide repeat protein [Niastella sp.]